MIASASRTSFPPCVAPGLGASPSRCPCALRALDYCLTEARYMNTDDYHVAQVYWESRDDGPAVAVSPVKHAHHQQ